MAKSTSITLSLDATPPTSDDAAAGKPRPIHGNRAVALVRSTAGSGTMTVTAEIHGFHPGIGEWFRLKQLNGAAAIAETEANRVAYVEALSDLTRFSRFAAVGSVAGTGTAAEVVLDFMAAGVAD